MKPIVAAALCLGLAAPVWADNVNDPYERYNRAMFKFNDKADQYVMSPVTKAYRKVTPKPVRKAARNFFDNLRDVQSFGSNVLRGNVKNATYDFMRVAVNTTFGLGGLINIADEAGMQNNKNTLGDTFASWGWKNSNYFVMPLTGPTTVRDGIGSVVGTIYSPTVLVHEAPARYGLVAINAVDTREKYLDATDTLDQMALDKYIVTRDTYIALRNKSLGIETPQEELPDPEAGLNADSEDTTVSSTDAIMPTQSETSLIPNEPSISSKP